MIFLKVDFICFVPQISDKINKNYFGIGKNDDANSGGRINVLLLPNTVK